MWKVQTQCFKKFICHTVLQRCDWDVTLLGIVHPHYNCLVGPRGPMIGGLCFVRDDQDSVCSDFATVGPDIIKGVQKAFKCAVEVFFIGLKSLCSSVGGDSLI